MKKAVIICILSLTLCLSQAAQKFDGNAVSNSTAPIEKTDGKDVKPIIAIVTTEMPNSPPAAKNTSAETIPGAQPDKKSVDATEKASADKPLTEKPEDNKTGNKTETTAKPSEGNKTTEAAPAKAADKPANKTEPAGGKETTPHPVVTSTEAPKAVTEKPMQATRGFDGPSFIGGIILTLGLLAIGFMGFKYYKNQTERNYHTL